MLLRKTAVLGLTVALLGLPVIASALDTYNYTDEASSVLITKNNTCSGPLYATAKRTDEKNPGHLSTSLFQAKILCGALSGECKAVMFNSATCASGGHAIANVTLQLNGPKAGTASVDGMVDTHYLVTTSGSTVNIAYAK